MRNINLISWKEAELINSLLNRTIIRYSSSIQQCCLPLPLPLLAYLPLFLTKSQFNLNQVNYFVLKTIRKNNRNDILTLTISKTTITVQNMNVQMSWVQVNHLRMRINHSCKHHNAKKQWRRKRKRRWIVLKNKIMKKLTLVTMNQLVKVRVILA